MKLIPSLDKKKSCNLSGQKEITQPLGTNNDATSWDNKKPRNLSGQKITHPLRTKISCNLSGQKYKKTSWDNNKKITQPLRTKKNHATSGTKKCNLFGQKIMLSKGSIVSKLVHKALNCSKWHQICTNGSK